MSSDHRKYNLKARAVRQARTRERIVAATAELHREIGPARTTVSEIARRAGVQRLTVYNHFPELKGLLGACQRHFLTAHPPPALAPGEADGATFGALERALAELYAWYRDHEALQRHVHRDRHLLPELDELMRENADPAYDAAAEAYARALATGPGARDDARRLIRVAMQFDTWWLLTRDDGADDASIARLMCAAARCAALARSHR